MAEQSEFEAFYYTAQDGLRLHARVYGRTHRRQRLPVICLPGLNRNARDFHELATYLSGDETNPRMVVAFDYRGRGLSDYDSDWQNYNVMTEATDIIAGLTALDIDHAAFIGTSRGGLIIHALAAMRAGALKAVVLNDVGPVVSGEGLARIRTYMERSPKPKDWDDVVAILTMANGDAFPALGDDDWQRMAHALFRDKDGRIVADFDPSLTKTVTSIDLSKPLPELWPQFIGLKKIPLMLIRGENSKLLSEKTVGRMQDIHADLELVVVKGQGHAPLLETGDLPLKISRFIKFADG